MFKLNLQEEEVHYGGEAPHWVIVSMKKKKRPLGKPRRTQDCKIGVNPKFGLMPLRDYWRSLVNVAFNLRVP
jgi:hypothetical protein